MTSRPTSSVCYFIITNYTGKSLLLSALLRPFGADMGSEQAAPPARQPRGTQPHPGPRPRRAPGQRPAHRPSQTCLQGSSPRERSLVEKQAWTEGITCLAGNKDTPLKAIKERLCLRCSLIVELFSFVDEEETCEQVKHYLALQLSAHTHLHTHTENSYFSPVNPKEETIVIF